MTIQTAIRTFLDHLLPPGEPLLVGVSGGADSVALLHVLVELGWRPHVCHLDHGWRGSDSEADAGFVRDLAERYDLPSTIDRAEPGEQTEDAARQARFAFFTEVARQTGVSKIALGHTADDQVETFLMRLIRGAGVPGLVGIWPDRKIGALRVIRPLLGATRTEVVDYLRAHDLAWREDASNRDTRYLRNRVRHELIPLIERDYNPAIRDVLRRTTEILRDEDFYLLRDIAQRYYLRTCRDDAVTLAVLNQQPAAVQRRLLRFWLGGESEDAGARYGFDHIESIRRIAVGDAPSAEVNLPGDLVVYREYDRLRKAARADLEPVAGEWALKIDGTTEIRELGVALSLCHPEPPNCHPEPPNCHPERGEGSAQDQAGGVETGQILRPPRTAEGRTQNDSGGKPTTAEGRTQNDKGLEEQFDADALGDRLTVRTWRAGDRFQPLGMAHEKKLQDFFVDEKVPRHKRGRTPLVCTGNGRIAWVIGHRISDTVKVTASTKRVLRIVARQAAKSQRPGGSRR